jgi:hypothetical protein
MTPSRERHTVNGKLFGIWYTTEKGNRVYIAHRQLRHLNKKYNGWSIGLSTLNKCREKGFECVGVVCRRGGKTHIWITRLDDFLNPATSFATRSVNGTERGVRLTHFRIDPANDSGKIDAAFKIS